MRTNEVLLQRLVGLSRHLHSLVNQSHLVDEQVTEHTGAVHHHIDPRTTQLFQRDELKLVHPTDGIRHRLDTHEPEDLGQGFAVGLDVVRTPEHTGNRFGPGSLFFALALDELVDDSLGRSYGSPGRDGLGIESMNVFATGQHTGIANRVSAGARKDVLTV